MSGFSATPYKLLLFLFVFLTACGGGREFPKITWYIQLEGKLDTTKNVKLYDVDLFNTSDQVIKELKAKGKTVICYFSAGTWEDWRPDAQEFPKEAIGKPYKSWDGEYFLDVRNEKVREIMVKRLKLAKQKGCDGVDPDNLDTYQYDTGFNLTKEDLKDYAIFLSKEAKKLGLKIGLKNNGILVKELLNYFDFSVVEECHKYKDCFYYYPFINSGKPVFNIEYEPMSEGEFLELCRQAKEEGFMTAVYNKALDGRVFKPCWEVW
ncbi:MAG: endo alpha-1,4 polygalactosaminidase [Aquifex sp.]|nr:MAG: endo alpha-1,4 polygalactosaminidase [Aquifex sp.]